MRKGGGVGIERVGRGLWGWALVVVGMLRVHVVMPGRGLGLLPFMLGFWAWLGGGVLFGVPFISMGWNGVRQLVMGFV